MAKLVYEHISRNNVRPPPLFIFDNASDLDDGEEDEFGIRGYLPHATSVNDPLVLITSQRTEWRRRGCATIDVFELNHEESLEFFLSRLNLSKGYLREDSELEHLVYNFIDTLSGYPLALKLAVSSLVPNVKATQENFVHLVKERLEEYMDSLDDLFLRKPLHNNHLDTNFHFPQTLLKAWEGPIMKTLERRRGAKNLLHILAYCKKKHLNERDASGIYGKTCEAFGVTFPTASDEPFKMALQELEKFCLVKLEKTGRLVWLQHTNSSHGSARCKIGRFQVPIWNSKIDPFF